MKRSLLLLGWTLLCALGPGHADTAYLQPGRVFSGDVVELVIEYDNRIPSLYALDTRALETDFEVLQVDSRVNRVNDGERAFHRMQSVVKLLPRRSGKLTVPGLQFGDRSSPALELEVLPLTAEMRARDRVMVELEAQPLQPYVGQQVLLRLRLINNVPIEPGNLVGPDADAAQRFHHHDLRRFREERDGQRFDVSEQTISLIPTRAGVMQLTAASYRGRMIPSRAGSADPEADSGRIIERRSAAPALKVRAPPTAYSGAFWLPASRVELTREWGKDSESPEVGDVLELELGITAVGLPAESLPANLYAFDGDDVKIYADQESRSNRFDGGNLVGYLQQRYVVVIARPGEIELPGLVLRWWDVTAEREREARIEPGIIVVGGSAAAAPRSNTDGSGGRIARIIANDWPWLLPLIGLALVILTPTGMRRRLIRRLRLLQARRRVRRGLRRACRGDDAAAARVMLLQWGRARWPQAAINGLFQLALLADDDRLRAQLQRLDARLFAAQAPRWRGEFLWRAIEGYEAGGRRRAEPDRLPRLYPAASSDALSSSDQPSTGSKRAPYLAA